MLRVEFLIYNSTVSTRDQDRDTTANIAAALFLIAPYLTQHLKADATPIRHPADMHALGRSERLQE